MIAGGGSRLDHRFHSPHHHRLGPFHVHLDQLRCGVFQHFIHSRRRTSTASDLSHLQLEQRRHPMIRLPPMRHVHRRGASTIRQRDVVHAARDLANPFSRRCPDQSCAVGGMRLKRINAPFRSDDLRAQHREISEIRPRIDEMIAGLKHPLDQPRGVQLIEPVRHAAIGIRRQIQPQAKAIGRRTNVSTPFLARCASVADELRETISTALGRRDAAVQPQRSFEPRRRSSVDTQTNPAPSRTADSGRCSAATPPP